MDTRNIELSMISLFAMIAVVWWHCYCGAEMERWFIPIFCVWSVPWFYFLSGVLFRKTLDSKSAMDVICGKMKSLFVPYVLWCGIGFAITSLIADGRGVPEVFGVTREEIHPWGNSALWYVRSLVVFMLITALANSFFRRFSFCGRSLAIAAISWILILLVSWRFVALGPRSSGLYFLGGFVVSSWILRRHSGSYVYGAVFLLIAIALRAIWFYIGYDFVHSGCSWLGNLSTVFMILAMLALVARMPSWIATSRFVKGCIPLTAFVYFMHYPINDVVKHYVKWMDKDILFMLLVLLAPIVYLLVAWVVKKYANRIYVILSGGR